MIKVNSIWKNKKTGNNYIVRQNCTNATNGFDGQSMVVYQKTLEQGTYWVREESEFLVKFELIVE